MRFEPIRFRRDYLEMSDATLDALRSQLKDILTELDNIQSSRRNMSTAAISTGQKKRQPSDQDQVKNLESPKKKQTPSGPTLLRERCTQLPSTTLPQQQEQQQEHQASCVSSSSNNLMVANAGVTTMTTAPTATSKVSIPTEVLRQLLRSRFLSSKDFSPLLLWTSKSILSDISQDNVYYLLSRNLCSSSLQLPRSLIQARGSQWLYTSLSKGLSKTQPCKWPTLAPPTLTPEKLVLLVSIWNGDREAISEAFQGDVLNELVRTGHAMRDLAGPVIMGEVTRENNAIRRVPIDVNGWSAKMHLFRLDSNQSCCVHDSKGLWWHFDGDFQEQVGNLHLCPTSVGLELTPAGQQLEGRIREHDRYLDHQSFEGICVEATMICETHPSLYDPNKMEVAFTKIQVELHSIYEFAGDVFHCEDDSLGHGVTALHLIDELRGWE
jgi:hypothetical protein